MATIALVLRILVGLPFLVFGLNHFLHFIPMDADKMPDLAKQFSAVLMATDYMTVVKVLEVVGGALLLVGRFVPLALILLVPVTVNIALWDGLIMKFSMPPLGTVLLVLEIVLLCFYRSYFMPLFTVKAKVGG